MGKFDRHYDVRDTITGILFSDLVGPVEKDEVIGELPSQYYTMGKIYPMQFSQDDAQEGDTSRSTILENETDAYDASVSMSNEREPSSFGITCTLKAGVTSFRLTGSYAVYLPMHWEDAVKLNPNLQKPDPKKKREQLCWQREEKKFDELADIADGAVFSRELHTKFFLQVYTNYVFEDGRRVITAVLVNQEVCPKEDKEKVNEHMVLQPVIRISGCDGQKIFTSVEQNVHLTKDEELLELEMLYRDSVCYAQGHGCSVTWDMAEKEPDYIETSFMPQYDLRQMKPGVPDDPELQKVFGMKWLAEAKKKEVIGGLRDYMNRYGIWIDERKKDAEKLEKNRDAALKNMKKCGDALQTIMKTIDRMEAEAEGGHVFRAFRLANEAMFLQRCATLKKDHKDEKDFSIDPDSISWYPFQLAFILQEMISFIEPEGEERKLADLLWFPTGGGKTEAYLGISAFVIFLRRLKNPADDGVTVMMRYTLRLLTTQQFERASALICACEKLRKRENIGGTPITAGLWVGDDAVPNHLKDASSNLDKVKNGQRITTKNPCQVKVCPWCGAEIKAADYEIDPLTTRMIISCPNEDCDFHGGDGLPLHLVDDCIYTHLPTFLVGTIDKFAQIPLSDNPASIFGIKQGKNPPELIIQDELHLISGPLGTITGAYEAAIGKICGRKGVPAKVVASTATIRNADNQIRSIFGRDHTQFPPQGINTDDSFFAVVSDRDEKPTRRYIGVLGVGTTATTTLIRINAALLFASRYMALQGIEDHVVDSYWTMTEYFNSLRELGGAATQILDDVQSRFAFLANTKFKQKYPGVDGTKKYVHNTELTSRMDNDRLTDVIQKELKWTYPKPDALDYVLASNMISVGVDVGRLGIMTVAGQPKTNAEYIQATSRVGRSNPGLVITTYNAARSRDRSHYEQFMKYHSSMYRYVEATSVTPFSDRARERVLPALFVSLVRYLVPGMIENEAAVKFRKNNPEIRQICQYILDYVETVDPAERATVEEELGILADSWEEQAHGALKYKSYKKDEKSLLKKDTEELLFSAMNSMRSIERQSGIYLPGGGN